MSGLRILKDSKPHLCECYNHDFNERAFKNQEEMSGDESNVVEIVESSVQLLEGHYKIKLHFRKENVLIPNDL